MAGSMAVATAHSGNDYEKRSSATDVFFTEGGDLRYRAEQSNNGTKVPCSK